MFVTILKELAHVYLKQQLRVSNRTSDRRPGQHLGLQIVVVTRSSTDSLQNLNFHRHITQCGSILAVIMHAVF